MGFGPRGWSRRRGTQRAHLRATPISRFVDRRAAGSPERDASGAPARNAGAPLVRVLAAAPRRTIAARNAGATLVRVLAAAPPPTIPAAVKAVYPRSPLRVVRTCRVDGHALVRLRVAGTESFVVLERVPRGWRVVWVDGRVARRVPAFRRARVAAQAARLRTRCLAP
jgi:hypothetical protein